MTENCQSYYSLLLIVRVIKLKKNKMGVSLYVIVRITCGRNGPKYWEYSRKVNPGDRQVAIDLHYQ